MKALLRTLGVTSVAGVVLAAGAVLATDHAAAQVACDPALSPPVAIGSPTADVGGVANAGSVEIHSACGGAALQTLTLPNPRSGERFGFAITDVNLSFDGSEGLLIGIPQYNAGNVVDAGAVASYHRVDGRFVLDRIITQDSPGIPGSVQAGAKFGSNLSAWIDPGEGYFQYVRIGVPRLDVDGVKDAGGVVDLDYSINADSGIPVGTLVADQTRLLTLNTPGVPWVAHAGDLFGAAVDVNVVGAPGRTINGLANAGAVLKQGAESGDYWVTQLTACVPGAPEAGDRFGAAVAGDWIGVPGEDVSGVADAGYVNRYARTQSVPECYKLPEQTKGFQGSLHAGDHFGATLHEQHDFTDGSYAAEQLIVGAPGADTSKGVNSGTVSWVSESYTEEEQTVTLGARGVVTGSRAGAALGTALGQTAALTKTSGYDLILAGAPGGRGVVNAYRSGRTSLTYDHAYVPAGSESGVFGAALGYGNL